MLVIRIQPYVHPYLGLTNIFHLISLLLRIYHIHCFLSVYFTIITSLIVFDFPFFISSTSLLPSFFPSLLSFTVVSSFPFALSFCSFSHSLLFIFLSFLFYSFILSSNFSLLPFVCNFVSHFSFSSLILLTFYSLFTSSLITLFFFASLFFLLPPCHSMQLSQQSYSSLADFCFSDYEI